VGVGNASSMGTKIALFGGWLEFSLNLELMVIKNPFAIGSDRPSDSPRFLSTHLKIGKMQHVDF